MRKVMVITIALLTICIMGASVTGLYAAFCYCPVSCDTLCVKIGEDVWGMCDGAEGESASIGHLGDGGFHTGTGCGITWIGLSQDNCHVTTNYVSCLDTYMDISCYYPED